jgi:beta-glucosidase
LSDLFRFAGNPIGRLTRRRLLRLALPAGLVAVALPMAASIAPVATAPRQAAGPSCPWLDQSLSVSKRVGMLLPRMSLADKIDMLAGTGATGLADGAVTTTAVPGLCIPALSLADGPNGVGDGRSGVTQLPAGASLAASWDASLARRYGQVVGAEERGKGIMVDLGPTINIDRDPRWGRSFESYSEDPYLNGALAGAEIGGVQSQGVMAQVKHYAVYNQETNRNTQADDAIVSERAEHEIYLPAFWAAIAVGNAPSMMCAYSTVNGVPACRNKYLIGETLDQRWGFAGFVSSDYGATKTTEQSVEAGLDQEMPDGGYYGAALAAAVGSGEVELSAVNQMVSRILTEMFRFGDFNAPRGDTPGEPPRVKSPAGASVVTTRAHQEVATDAAEAGTVLLRNTGSVLPLPESGAGAVAVIGPGASAAPTDSGGGSAHVTAPFSVTPLQGIRAAAKPGTTVSYSQGLPADTSLSPIPASALTSSGRLTAPQTGTYVIALKSPSSRAVLSLDGKQILADAGTPPADSVGVNLRAGRTYTLRVSGADASTRLSWATPSDLAPGIARAVAASRAARTAVVVVSDDTESEATDRSGLNLPSAQNELISAVAAANPRTVVVIDAGAPVVMPWISQVASVVDAWYPGESNGTALAAVLFGRVDPGGHLPITFPVGLSQVPASSPSQFPGRSGQVLYSEGIDVGYRYYDAKNETPLFAFGYGLSYTRFSYSHLTVTPRQVQNGSSNPGATSCGCNGQSGKQVTVTATVTNTGKIAGSDVAQLYLGDPASAGEPPRQLKGFKRVTLRPGQSTTVRFTLNGHDLSYWDDTADGWVLPDGRYQVYVGDSSALANLPLRAGFTVTRSLYARYATLQAPAAMGAGGSDTVTATVVNDGDYAMPGARLMLHVPAGWTVTPLGPLPAVLGPHQSATVRFRVAVPVTAQPGTDTLTLKAGYQAQPGARGGVIEATATVTIPAFTPAAGLAEGWPAG